MMQSCQVKVAGAALDVFEEEPFVEHKFLTLPQVIATPHLGASTIEAQEIVAIDVSYDVVSFLQNGTVKNPVNLSSVPKDVLLKLSHSLILAEQLGSFLSDLADGVPEEVNITYSGELAKSRYSSIIT